MTFQTLAQFLEKLQATSSRNKITEILAELFAKVSSQEIDKICYLLLGRLAPLYAGREFNLAEKMMVRILANAYEKSRNEVQVLYKKKGDLGNVVQELAISDKKQAIRTRRISVSQVYEQLLEIAQESGKGSQERKMNKMAKLFSELDSLSAKFFARIPVGKLRLGFSEVTILDALSVMEKGDKSARLQIEQAYNITTDVGKIAQIIKTAGLKDLKRMKISLGTPIMFALSQRLANAEEMIAKMAPREKEKVAVEPKYDGTRLQVHFIKGKEPWFFTRNLENVTAMFPDLAEACPREIQAQKSILDGEAIGFNPQTGKFLPFQETIKRKRKYEVGQKAKEIPLKLFVFDVLHKNGQDLLDLPFRQRRQILEQTLARGGKTILLSPQILTSSVQELRRYHDEQVAKGLEGVMVKKWESPYEPGRRGFTWVKFKSEKGKKGAGLADTLDCVVMGYYLGRGKRADFGIGVFLVGVKKGEQFLTISKIGTGLTDEQWRDIKVQSSKLKVKIQPKEYVVNKNLSPDVWCQPKIVAEIEADNITKSPIHTSQYALRFPRLIRFRDDKNPQDTTTIKEIEEMYRFQFKKKG